MSATAPMPLQNTLYPIGSISTLMDELFAVEERVHKDLRVYRWQPNAAQLPALWNWCAPSSFAIQDLTRWRDSMNIIASVGVAHSDNEVEMARLEIYADAFRDVVDQELARGKAPINGLPSPGPLNGAVTKAARQNMVGPIPVDMNGIPVLTFQFGLLFELDRKISPTGQ